MGWCSHRAHQTVRFIQRKLVGLFMSTSQAETAQQTMLNRLLQTEAEAQTRRTQAQDHVRELHAASDAQIQQQLATARANANAEAQTYRDQMKAELETTIQQLAATNQQTIEAMRQQAQAHMDAAVALVVDWVTGQEISP